MTSPTTRARLDVPAIGPQAHLGHLVQDAALHGLEPVAGVGQGARVDDRVGVLEERALHLGGDVDVFDALAGGRVGELPQVGVGSAGGSHRDWPPMLPALETAPVRALPMCCRSCARTRCAARRIALGLPPVHHARSCCSSTGSEPTPSSARRGTRAPWRRALGKTPIDLGGFPTTTAVGARDPHHRGAARPARPGRLHACSTPTHDRVVNQLTGWDDRIDPDDLAAAADAVRAATAAGVAAIAIGAGALRATPASRARCSAAREYLGAAHDRRPVRSGASPSCARRAARSSTSTCRARRRPRHAHGWESAEWIGALETLDAAVAELAPALAARAACSSPPTTAWSTCPPHAHVLLDERPTCSPACATSRGEPRCLQLHLEPGVDRASERSPTRWRAARGRPRVGRHPGRGDRRPAGSATVDPEVAPAHRRRARRRAQGRSRTTTSRDDTGAPA